MTYKGELVRTILFPRPASFRFYHDILKCAMLMGFIGICGTVYSSYVWIRNGVPPYLNEMAGIFFIWLIGG